MITLPPEVPAERGHYVYVLACADGTLYTGYTVDLAHRLAVHQAGKGAKYTRARLPVTLQGWWRHEDRRAAMSAEAAFKRLDRPAKLSRLAAFLAQFRPTTASGV